MKRWFLPLFTAGVLLLAGWLFYREAWIATRGGVASPLYSAERFDPYGVAALYRLYQQQGLSVTRLQRPDLSQQDKGVLIQIVPSTEALTFQEEVELEYKKNQSQPKDGQKNGQDDDHAKDKQENESQPAQQQKHAVHLGGVNMNPYALSDQEILEWVSQGNTLVQMSHTRTRIMDMVGVPLSHAVAGALSGYKVEEMERRGTVPDLLPEPAQAKWTDAAKRDFAMRGQGPLLVSPLVFADQGGRAGWVPLLTVNDQAVAGQIKYGRGLVVVIGAPTPALNQMLGRGGNLMLMLQLADKGPVIFDAWSNEPGQAGSMMGLIRQFGLLPVLLQLFLLMLVYHWSTQGRRREIPLEMDRPRSSVEQILTLGYLYDQAMEAPVAAARTAREIQHRVAKGLSCSVAKISRRLEQKDVDPARAKQAKELLAAAETLRNQWPGCCRQCGHDFKAKAMTHCPSCGQVVSPQTTQTKQIQAPDLRMLTGDLSRLLTLSHEFATGKKS